MQHCKQPYQLVFADKEQGYYSLKLRYYTHHLFFNIGLSCVHCIMSLHSHLEDNTSFKLLLKTKPDQSKINENKPIIVQETTDVI